jgi:hypothetical protein
MRQNPQFSQKLIIKSIAGWIPNSPTFSLFFLGSKRAMLCYAMYVNIPKNVYAKKGGRRITSHHHHHPLTLSHIHTRLRLDVLLLQSIHRSLEFYECNEKHHHRWRYNYHIKFLYLFPKLRKINNQKRVMHKKL